MSRLAQSDPQVFEAIHDEERRQREDLELIASENYTSAAVMEAVGSVLTNKYAEGLPGKRYYGGCQFVDRAEQLAIDRVKALFGAEHANVQPHSGASANQAVYFAALEIGDRVLAMDLALATAVAWLSWVLVEAPLVGRRRRVAATPPLP